MQVRVQSFTGVRGLLEETTRTTADDLDEDGAERPRLPRAVMERRSQPGPESTTLVAVGNQWRYALVVVQAGDDDDDDATLKGQRLRAGWGY